MADEYPNAEIVGIDLSGFRDERYLEVFPNLSLHCPLDFTDGDWGLEMESFDFIHMSLLCGSVPDWPALYRKVMRYLKPGTGQIEHVELDWRPRSDEKTFLAQGRPMLHWYEDMVTSSRRRGLPFAYREDTGEALQSVGFTNVSDMAIKIPFYVEVGDPYLWDLACWFRGTMGHIGTYQSLCMSLFTQQLGYSPERVEHICQEVTDVLNLKRIPLYHNL